MPVDKTNPDPTPRVTPTTVDAVDPSVARQTAAESDPPTRLVRRDAFVELPPGSVVGEIYEVDARLGAGAMGEVYAARHVRLGKRVAIKVIGERLSEDSAAIERFAMEARTLAKIQHPAIVAVEHVGELADGRAYFVMEFLRGETLFDRISRGRVPLPEALRILDQIARGLEAAHAEGVTHRDLKPENVFLVHLPGEPPIVKLVDFGLAKLRRPDVDFRAERTQSGVAIGTPLYMSPEQMRGPDVDPRTDVYALGVIAYELVLGSLPFPRAQTAPALYAAHLHEAPILPRSVWPEIPPQLDLVLFAMLAKDPAHRPTLAQVRAVVGNVRAPQPSRAETELVVPREFRSGGKVAGVVAAALVIGIAIGVIATFKADAPAAPQPPIATVAPAPVVAPIVTAAPIVTSLGSGSATRPIARSSRSTAAHVAHAPPAPAPIAPSITPDAGIELDAPPPPRSPDPTPAPRSIKPIDRNQTVNPFAKHKVNP